MAPTRAQAARSATKRARTTTEAGTALPRALGAFRVTLPYPPSVNHLWRRVGTKTLLSAEGRRYHEAVGAIVRQQGGALPPPPHLVSIVAVVPDKRRRDIDNVIKAVLDPIYRAFDKDDCVIKFLAIEKRDLDEHGPRAEVEIQGY